MTRSYKLGLLASLYLAQGLPYGFFTQALPVLLREQGLSLKAISLTSFLFLPWALKFLWAPFVDRYGTERQWLLPLQFCAVALALALTQADLAQSLWPVLLALLLFNALAAAQDVATDGLAVRLLSPAERGLGNGIQVGAYRVGMILGGGLLLWVFAHAGWPAMFVGMAALLLVCALPVMGLRPQPRAAAPARAWTRVAVGWLPRLRARGVAGFVGLICLYKFGDTMVASLVGPFMRDTGIGLAQIAIIKGTLGSSMGLAGALAGGFVAWRLGRRAALLGCGLLQTASLALYAAAALGHGGVPMIYAASTAEHLFGGMATVALFTLMMDAADPEHASTDYTLFACAIVIAQGLANFSGAALADAFGYAPMFVLGVVLSGLGCLALVRALDKGFGPPRVRNVWPQPGRS